MISPKNIVRICLIIIVVAVVVLGGIYYYTEENLNQWGKGTLITIAVPHE